MTDLSEVRCLIVGMGGISRQMHGVLKAEPWFDLPLVVAYRVISRQAGGVP